MFWKINYVLNNQKDCLYFGGWILKEDKKERIKRLKDLGFEILSIYKVKNLC